jgi:hypothetical protein
MVDNARETLRDRFRQMRERAAAPRRKAPRPAAPAPVPVSLVSQPLFGDLSQSEAALLGLFVQRESAETGQVIVRQGDEGDALFLIESGEVEVRARDDEGQEATNADVVALTPLTLLRLDRSGYELLTQAAATEELRHTAQRRAEETQEKLGHGTENEE